MTRLSPKIKLPFLLTLAIIIILVMLRLAVWQLDRAEQKQVILSTLSTRSAIPPVQIGELKAQLSEDEHRFRLVTATGEYLPEQSIYVDNQVVAGKVGYQIFTPLKLSGSASVIMVDRGWLPVGQSRDVLPSFATPAMSVGLTGRLNSPPAQPPLWDTDYPVFQGQVWAYLPLSELADQLQLNIMPLVLELAPENASDAPPQKIGEAPSMQDHSDQEFIRVWDDINDEWVAKHKGYAFQWFAMATMFFIACLVLLMRTLGKNNKSE